MPIAIKTTYTIQPDTADSRSAWKVASDNIKQLETMTFIKLVPTDIGFIRLICAGVIELPKQTACRVTLTQTPGWAKLMKLRNDAAFRRDVVASAESALFDAVDAESTQKRRRVKRTQLQQMRDERATMVITVPGAAVNPDFDVNIIKPVHPAEGLWLHFDELAMQHVVDFVRADLTLEDLTMKRAYGQEGKGIWHNGSAGLVQKLAGEDNEPEGYETPQKWRSVKGDTQPDPIGNGDDIAHSEETVCADTLVEVGVQSVAQPSALVKTHPFFQRKTA